MRGYTVRSLRVIPKEQDTDLALKSRGTLSATSGQLCGWTDPGGSLIVSGVRGM